MRRLLEEKNLPALLVMQAENRRYLSGFTGSAGVLLITPTRAILATDFRYWEQGAQQAPDFTVYPAKGGLKDYLPGLIAEAGNPARIGFESNTVTVAQYRGYAEGRAADRMERRQRLDRERARGEGCRRVGADAKDDRSGGGWSALFAVDPEAGDD